MNYKLLILDFDGTLGDTCGLIVRTMQQTIAVLNLPARTDAQCAAMIGLPLKQTFTQLIDMTDEMGDRCAEVYTRFFHQNNTPGAVPVFPNVISTIKAVHDAGVLITIASSRSRGSLNAFIDSMGLRGYIPYVVSANDIENAKPAPDMVLKTLADNNMRPEDAIVVGDTTFDILMAHAAGVPAVGVTYGNGKRSDLEEAKAEFIIDDFSEVLGIVVSK